MEGYLTFYKATLAPGASDVPGSGFTIPRADVSARRLCDGKLIGIVQYLFHRSTWTPATTAICRICSSERARGLGAAGR